MLILFQIATNSMMNQSERGGREGGHNYRSGGEKRGSRQQLGGGARNSQGQYHRQEKENGKNAAIEETKAMMAKMRMEEKEAIEKHKREQEAVEKRRREKTAIENSKPEKDANDKQKKEKGDIENNIQKKSNKKGRLTELCDQNDTKDGGAKVTMLPGGVRPQHDNNLSAKFSPGYHEFLADIMKEKENIGEF